MFSLLNCESKSERKSLGFLLWLVSAQHDHYESKCERKSGGKCFAFPFHYENESERKTISKFSFVISGKKKAHKHKSFWPVTPPVTRGSPDREARGQSFMYYPRNPRNINLFVRIPDREDRGC